MTGCQEGLDQTIPTSSSFIGGKRACRGLIRSVPTCTTVIRDLSRGVKHLLSALRQSKLSRHAVIIFASSGKKVTADGAAHGVPASGLPLHTKGKCLCRKNVGIPTVVQ